MNSDLMKNSVTLTLFALNNVVRICRILTMLEIFFILIPMQCVIENHQYKYMIKSIERIWIFLWLYITKDRTHIVHIFVELCEDVYILRRKKRGFPFSHFDVTRSRGFYFISSSHSYKLSNYFVSILPLTFRRKLNSNFNITPARETFSIFCSATYTNSLCTF